MFLTQYRSYLFKKTFSDMTSSMADPDYCPFLHLHPNIELAILEQLDFRDFVNLALSCRKWYQTASSAPNHVKPICMFDRIHVSNGSFMLYFKYPEISKLVSTSHLKFALVNKIKCKEVRIERKESDKLDGSSVLELLRFLWSNKQYFDIDLIHIDWPQIDDEEYALLESVLDMTPFISFASQMDNFPYKMFFEKHLSHEVIKSRSCLDYNTYMMFLQQCMNGERPKFKAIAAQYTVADEMNFMHQPWSTFDFYAHLETMDYIGTIGVDGSLDLFFKTNTWVFELKRSREFDLIGDMFKEGMMFEICDTDWIRELLPFLP